MHEVIDIRVYRLKRLGSRHADTLYDVALAVGWAAIGLVVALVQYWLVLTGLL